MFGAVTNISQRGAISLAGASGGIISSRDSQSAYIYVLDPNNRTENQLTLGDYGTVSVDEKLFLSEVPDGYTRTVTGSYDNGGTFSFPLDGVTEYTLFTRAFAYCYEDHVVDIVLYQPLSYTYSYVDTKI